MRSKVNVQNGNSGNNRKQVYTQYRTTKHPIKCSNKNIPWNKLQYDQQVGYYHSRTVQIQRRGYNRIT